jgi:hypothetical protein
MKELTKEIGFIFGICYIVGLVSSIYHLNNIGLPLFPSNIFLSLNELFYGSIMVLLAFVTQFTTLSLILSEPIKDANKWLEWSSFKTSGYLTKKILWLIRYIMTLQLYTYPYLLISFIIIGFITKFNIYAMITFYIFYIFWVTMGSILTYRNIKGTAPKDDQPMVGKYASPIFGPEKEDIINILIGIAILALMYSFLTYNYVSPTFGGGMRFKVIPLIDINYKNDIIFDDKSKLDNQKVYLIGQSLEFIAFTKIDDTNDSNVIFIRRDKLIALKKDDNTHKE